MKEWIEQLAPRASAPVMPASAPGVIAAAVRDIGESATNWAVEMARSIVDEVEDEFRSSDSAHPMTGSEREACEASLLTALGGLHRGVTAPELLRAEGAAQNVKLAARQSVPLGTLLRTVWACHTRVQDALLREVAARVPSDALVDEVRELNGALFSYADAIARQLMVEYDRELAAWSDHLPAERRRIAAAIRAGELPPPNAERLLGLRLTDYHLSAIASHLTSDHIPDRHARLTQLGIDLARQLGATTNVTMQHDGIAEYWWTFVEPIDESSIRRAFATAIDPSLWIAVGTVGQSVSGYRRSHAAATQAARVARISETGGAWHYADVSVVALLAQNEDAARRFVEDELGGLRGTDLRSSELRATLRQFLLSGGSRIAAARELSVAPTTVAYRVRGAFELIGHSTSHGPSPTLLALELAHYFPGLLEPAALHSASLREHVS